MQQGHSIRCGRSVSLVVTLALGLGTLGALGAALPVYAGETAGANGAPAASAISEAAQISEAEAGPFDLGDGFTASVAPSTRALLLHDPATGALWDSSALDIDRYDLGPGWTWSTPYITTEGGVEVQLPGLGGFEFDPAEPSGLKGYPGPADFVFSQAYSVVPARDDIPERESFFQRASHGVTDYFSPGGELITTIDAAGGREDREYDEAGTLTRIVHADGGSTEISYDVEGITLTRPDGVRTNLWRTNISTGPTIGSIVGPERNINLTSTSPEPFRYHMLSTLSGAWSLFEYDAAEPGAVTKIHRDGSVIYPAP